MTNENEVEKHEMKLKNQKTRKGKINIGTKMNNNEQRIVQ